MELKGRSMNPLNTEAKIRINQFFHQLRLKPENGLVNLHVRLYIWSLIKRMYCPCPMFALCKMPCESAVDLRASALCCQRTKLNEQKVDEYCRILAEIAAEQKFEVTYVDLPDPSLTGEFYLWFRRQHCLVCQSFYLCRFSPNVLRMSRFAGFLPGQHQCMVELRHKKDKSRKPIVCLGMGDSQQRAHEIGAQNALSTLDGLKERNTWKWSVCPCRCHYVPAWSLFKTVASSSPVRISSSKDLQSNIAFWFMYINKMYSLDHVQWTNALFSYF